MLRLHSLLVLAIFISTLSLTLFVRPLTNPKPDQASVMLFREDHQAPTIQVEKRASAESAPILMA